jgi:predicted DNA-binding transcriptional regulator YafY
MVQAWLDPALARDAEAALGKILSVLPTGTRAAAESTRIYAPPRAQDNAVAQHLQSLREAAQARHKVRLHYTTIEGEQSIRVVRPLGCFYWGSVWTLGAWCEKRQALRSFRVDLMASCECLDDSFMDEAGKTLADFLRSVGARLPGTGNT